MSILNRSGVLECSLSRGREGIGSVCSFLTHICVFYSLLSCLIFSAGLIVFPVRFLLQTIGKTTKKDLNGDVITTFPPLILSSSVFEAENVRETGGTPVGFGLQQ